MAQILKYRGGGMAPNSAASRLAKMMQSYRNGGYVYAQNGDEVTKSEDPFKERAELTYDLAGSMMEDAKWYKDPFGFEIEHKDEDLLPETEYLNFKDNAIEEALRLQKINPKSEEASQIADAVGRELDRSFYSRFEEQAPIAIEKYGSQALGGVNADYLKSRVAGKIMESTKRPVMEDYYPDMIGRAEYRQKVDPVSGELMFEDVSREDPAGALWGYRSKGYTFMPESERKRPEFESISPMRPVSARIPGGANSQSRNLMR